MPRPYGRQQKPNKLVALVEGYQDRSVRILIERWLELCGLKPKWDVEVIPARKMVISVDNVEHMIRAYILGENPTAILILRDNDGDCPRYKGEQGGMAGVLLRAAYQAARNIKVGVVIADYCYETWLVACREELAARHLVKQHTYRSRKLEDCQDFKSVLKEMMAQRRDYNEITDMLAMTEALPLDLVIQRETIKKLIARAPSYGNLILSLERLTGHQLVSNKIDVQPAASPCGLYYKR